MYSACNVYTTPLYSVFYLHVYNIARLSGVRAGLIDDDDGIGGKL